jgi:RecJ-like exonuclease
MKETIEKTIVRCPSCDGWGHTKSVTVYVDFRGRTHEDVNYITCPHCNGTGKILSVVRQ